MPIIYVLHRTSGTSVRSSIYESVEENGRSYHRFKQGSRLRLTTYSLAPIVVSLTDSTTFRISFAK